MTDLDAFYSPVGVESISLVRKGDYAVVEVQVRGKYFEVMREHIEGNFSHNVSAGGIRLRLDEAPETGAEK